MRTLDPVVGDAVWAAIEPLLPAPDQTHPLGCHRPRVADRVCFDAMLIRLVPGCSWVDAEQLSGNRVSDTTLRARRDEWIAAGVFDTLEAEVLAGYDRIIGLDLSDVAIDGSLHKAPGGGEGAGKNPTDRGKLGCKWVHRHRRQRHRARAANRNDIVLLEPTLDEVERRGLLTDIDTLHLDKGYDSQGARDHLAARGIEDAIVAAAASAARTPTRSPVGRRTDQQLAQQRRPTPPEHRPAHTTSSRSVLLRSRSVAHR